MEEDRARPDPIHRDLCSQSLWQAGYHLGCDLTAGWDSPSHWPAPAAGLRLRVWQSVCKSESETATGRGSLPFGLGVTRSDYNHDMSGSLAPAKPTL